ncbi:pentapeptide repeat-containing protein [Flavobacterium sp. KACC 22763]|uniref:pentapeptide repeat-containing protein n=1 Tax=Flavobacterium sp. KACC 22763 TaxID=3025668 RepID=UPI0023666141|nr:pentapeptide repeat-containing protein [Flavobacterium sp. KACC 22763]WDF65467.1 pentapeptide repeat-containing protein [Flavobacterium sp. KACC 22763]
MQDSRSTKNPDLENQIKSLYLNSGKEKDDEKIAKLTSIFEKSEKSLMHTGRIERKDVKFYNTDFDTIEGKRYYYIEDLKYSNYLFVRAVATDFIFKNIDFSKTIFDNCYLKDCRFINCKFEGAKFSNSNLQGSYFRDCNFDYVTFEKTFVDYEIFECAPKWDNLRFRFARSLKLNYASIGDYIKASKAVTVELQATLGHLRSSWSSGDPHYSIKFGGFEKRMKQLYKWTKVHFLDFIWGNGESLRRLIRFNFIVFLALSVVEVFTSESKYGFLEFLETLFVNIPSVYFGLKVENFEYSNYILLPLTILRLVSFALLMSIITKKYNRR